MLERYKKTNLFLIHEGLWNWAKYQASLQGFDSVSKYVFKLIKDEKDAFMGEVMEDDGGLYLSIGGSINPRVDFEQLFRPFVGKRVKVKVEEIIEL